MIHVPAPDSMVRVSRLANNSTSVTLWASCWREKVGTLWWDDLALVVSVARSESKQGTHLFLLTTGGSIGLTANLSFLEEVGTC